MQKHLNIKIYGKVQGVWYRGSTQKKARELGIKGFVQNETDGSVYAEAEGTEVQLKALTEWCKEGPLLAQVTKVEVEEGTFEGFTDFIVNR